MEFIIILGAFFVIGFVMWNSFRSEQKKAEAAKADTWPFPIEEANTPPVEEKPKAKRKPSTKKAAPAKKAPIKKAPVKKAPVKKAKK